MDRREPKQQVPKVVLEMQALGFRHLPPPTPAQGNTVIVHFVCEGI